MKSRNVPGLALALCLGGFGCSAGSDAVETSADAVDSVVVRAPSAPGVDIYAGVVGLTGTALKSALFDLVKNHQVVSYDRARQLIFTSPGFVSDTGTVECIYTGRVVPTDGTTGPGGFNTEHSWPQSLGASSGPAHSDLHHLFAVDGHANSSRGNNPFDFVTCLQSSDNVPSDFAATPVMPAAPSCVFASGGSALGKNDDGRAAWEVRKEKRGDIARAHFYFSIRYNMPIGPSEETALRQWNDEDPVDTAELKRNDLIEQTQRNRDPFVDHPEFVAAITDF